MKKTIVISAFPACGKTYAFNAYQSKFSMLDSDSSNFSWVKDEDGNNTKDRNPDFPANYIQHIKDNIGKVDIIFVSSHLPVRQAMTEAGIKFWTVYPEKCLKNEFVGRMYLRGTIGMIDFIASNWDSFIDEISNGGNSGCAQFMLGDCMTYDKTSYLNNQNLDYIITQSMYKGYYN